MSKDDVVDNPTAADWEEDVVAVGRCVGEVPVVSVGSVPRSLEGERQHARVVVECRIHNVLRRVTDGLRAPTCRPTTRNSRPTSHLQYTILTAACHCF